MDDNQLKVRSYQHWEVILHPNQCYLGRVFVLLKEGEEAEDFLAIEAGIRQEFFLIGNHVKQALKTLFKPDKFNYAALSNVSEKMHVHIIPRYRSQREWYGRVFVDSRWGKNYAPYDRSFHLEEAVLFNIRDVLIEQLSLL